MQRPRHPLRLHVVDVREEESALLRCELCSTRRWWWVQVKKDEREEQ
jgi:hypothetical protein